jgi:hypothetical protein
MGGCMGRQEQVDIRTARVNSSGGVSPVFGREGTLGTKARWVRWEGTLK